MTQFRLLLIAVFLIALSFITAGHHLTGKWTIYDSNGRPGKEYVEFKTDGTYNVFLPNGQVGESGYYKLKDDLFSIRNAKDHVCGKGYWGKYKLEFHGEDSIHFSLVQDTCANRRYDIVGVNPGLRRIKTK